MNPDLSDRVNEAIIKGLEIEPSDRPKSMSEWLELLSEKTLKNGCYRLEKIIPKDCLGENEAYNLAVVNNVVYLGKEISSNIPVVIKTIDLEHRNNNNLDKAISCLKNEAKLLKQIKQYQIPNLVGYRDSFEENGIFYLVMDFVSGENLYRLISKKGKLSEAEAIDYILQISGAVASCYQEGIFHRDIHPSNIILTNEGKVVLVDFDVAANPDLSGSPYFQPPYRSKIKKSEDIDLYSLAATLYYLVTGVNPASIGINHSWFDYSDDVFKLKPPKYFNPDLSDRMNEFILKGMELEPQNRPRMVGEWLELWISNKRSETIVKIESIEPLAEPLHDAKFYCDRAWEKFENNDYQGAIEDCDLAINFDAQCADAYYSRGKIHIWLEDYERAIEDYTEAIRLNPENDSYYNERGYVREKLGNYQGVIEDYTEAIRLNPENDNYYHNRGNARLSLKDYQGAIENYTEAMNLDPGNADLYLWRGIARDELKDRDRAIQDFTQAIRLDPENALYYEIRCAVRYKLGDTKGAKSDLEQAKIIKGEISTPKKKGFFDFFK